mgnify:CR=1 FL=1
MHFALKTLRPTSVYVPFYVCDTLLDAFRVANIPFKYYGLQKNLTPTALPVLKDKEYFLWVNYFGVKSDMTDKLYRQYGSQLILDNTHAFFHRPPADIWAFNSVRKFMGVPDGAFLYSPLSFVLDAPRNTDLVYTHLIEELLGNREQAYQDFLKNEALISTDIKKCSMLSQKIMETTDFERIKQRRIHNFKYLHQQLSTLNQLDLTLLETDVPLCYPFLPSKPLHKPLFHQQHFYIPSYWPEVIENPINGFQFEKEFASKLLPLPIDQRYVPSDLVDLVDFIQNMALE